MDHVIRFLWHFFLRPENRPRGSLTHLSHSESRNFLFRVKVETRHALSAWPTYLERNGHWKWRAHSSCHCSDVGHLELSRLGFQGLLTATKASYVHKLTRLGSACFWILMLMMMLIIAMLMMRMMSKNREHFFHENCKNKKDPVSTMQKPGLNNFSSCLDWSTPVDVITMGTQETFSRALGHFQHGDNQTTNQPNNEVILVHVCSFLQYTSLPSTSKDLCWRWW